jgi:hypothetical protein
MAAKEGGGKFDVSLTTSAPPTGELLGPFFKVQCCQGAEILATEHKRGPTKIPAARKIGGQIFFKYAKKRAEKGPNFLKMIFHIKSL